MSAAPIYSICARYNQFACRFELMGESQRDFRPEVAAQRLPVRACSDIHYLDLVDVADNECQIHMIILLIAESVDTMPTDANKPVLFCIPITTPHFF